MPEQVAPSRSDSLRPEMDLLLSCARTRLTPEIAARIRAAVQKDISWLALIRLVMRHDVMPLLYRNLQQVCPDAVPDYISGPLRARHEARVAEALRHAEELVRVLAVFADGGIRAVPYKGPALAQRLYGDLSLRPFGDLDILIFERDVPKARDLIRSLGYEFVSQSDAENFAEHLPADRQFQFEGSDGTRLELHWGFAPLL